MVVLFEAVTGEIGVLLVGDVVGLELISPVPGMLVG